MKISRRFLQKAAVMLDSYSQQLEIYSHFHPRPLSIEKFVVFGSKTGSEETSFDFLRHELPVRLANMMKEMSLLPDNLLHMPSVELVQGWYEQSFREILEFENAPCCEERVMSDFAEALIKIKNRHTNVVETMAQGVMELKETYGTDSRIENQIQYFLDRFYANRISIRMLINQHALLYSSQLTNHPRHVGSIDPNCDVLEVVKDAFANARFLCEQYYLIAPEVTYISQNYNLEDVQAYENDNPINIVYVPSHLYQMLFELMKNAMRAVVEHHSKSAEVPKLSVMICKGKEDLSIKLSDQGGGIPYTQTDRLFQYMYSTAPQPSQGGDGSAPLAGYGYGLPLSRLYARYFQGDIVLNSIEGYGTDAMIYMKVMSNQANECIPVFNKTVCRMYVNDIPVSDWSSPQPQKSGRTVSRSYSNPS